MASSMFRIAYADGRRVIVDLSTIDRIDFRDDTVTIRFRPTWLFFRPEEVVVKGETRDAALRMIDALEKALGFPPFIYETKSKEQKEKGDGKEKEKEKEDNKEKELK